MVKLNLEEAKRLYFENITHENVKGKLISASVGMIAFPSMLGLMQYFWKLTRISAHSKFAPVCGFLSLSVSSYTASLTTMIVQTAIQGQDENMQIFEKETLQHVVFSSCLSLVTFYLLRGKLRNLGPSHIFQPGAFAVEKIPLLSINTLATHNDRKLIQEFGRRYGCHTCGQSYPPCWYDIRKFFKNTIRGHPKTASVNYISDHVPPQALADKPLKPMLKMRNKNQLGALYPQCETCSLKQAHKVKSYLNGKYSYRSSAYIFTHVTSVRLHKLWIPWPLLIQSGFFNDAMLQLIQFLQRFL